MRRETCARSLLCRAPDPEASGYDAAEHRAAEGPRACTTGERSGERSGGTMRRRALAFLGLFGVLAASGVSADEGASRPAATWATEDDEQTIGDDERPYDDEADEEVAPYDEEEPSGASDQEETIEPPVEDDAEEAIAIPEWPVTRTAWVQMRGLPFSDVQDVVVDPKLVVLVYARRPSGVYVSWDLGERFRRSLHQPTELIAVDPNRAATAFTGRDAWHLTESGGLLWSEQESTLRVGSTLAIAPKKSDLRWTSSPSWGVIFRSFDGGLGWQPTRSTPRRCCSQLVALSARDLYAFSTFESFHRSFDGGDSWAYGTRHPGLSAPAMIAVDPKNAEVIYAVSYDPSDGGLSKSVDGGRTWFRPSAHFEGALVSAVAVSQADDRVYIVETRVQGPGFRVHVSKDGGETFSVATSGLEQSRIARIVPHPRVPCVAFAVTDRGVFRTTSGGGSCRAPGK